MGAEKQLNTFYRLTRSGGPIESGFQNGVGDVVEMKEAKWGSFVYLWQVITTVTVVERCNSIAEC